jgi:hypothetical protein
MQISWFDIGWPFVGLGGTIVMIAMMMLTDTFRGNTAVSRWRDPVWLGWLAAPIYWVHQFEELNLQVLGFDYSFQEMVCKNFGYPPYPDCPIPFLLPGGEHRPDVGGSAAGGLSRQSARRQNAMTIQFCDAR